MKDSVVYGGAMDGETGKLRVCEDVCQLSGEAPEGGIA